MNATNSARNITTLALAAAALSLASCAARNEATISRQTTGAPAAAVASFSKMLGTWTVVTYHMPGVSAMSNTDAKAWLGRTVRLTLQHAISTGTRCNEPAYAADSVNTNRFLASEFNLPPGSLKPLASVEQITVLQVLCGSQRWAAMGGQMIRIDDDRALAVWNGVFFELARDRASRAVGQTHL